MTKDGRDIVKYATVLLVLSLFASVLQWVFHVFVSRGLGPSGYGAYTAVLSIFIIFVYPLSALQMAVADRTSRYSAMGKEKSIGGLLRRMMAVVVFSLLAVFLGVLVGGPFLVEKWKLHANEVWVLGFLVVAAVLMTVVRGLLQGLQRFVALGLNVFVDSFVRCLCGLVLVYLMHRGVAAALGSSIISAAVAGASGIWLLRRYVFLRGTMGGKDLKKMLFAFMPMLLAMLFYGIMTNADMQVVRTNFSAEESGYFGAAHKVGEIFIYIPMAIIGVMFPKVAARSEQRKGAVHLLFLSLGYATIICVAGGVFCAIFPGFVTRMIFGAEFLPAKWMVRLFPLVFTPFSLANMVMNYLIARGRFSFCYLVGVLVVLYLVALWFFHSTLGQIMALEFIFGVVLLVSLLVFGRRPGRQSAQGGN